MVSEYAIVGAVSYVIIFLFFGGVHVWDHFYNGGARLFNIKDKADYHTMIAWVLFIISLKVIFNAIR